MWTGVGGGEGESKIDENVWISFVNDLYSKKKTSVDTFKNTGEKDEEKKRQLQSLLRYTHAQKMILIENLACLVLSSQFPVKDVFRNLSDI